MRIVPAGGSDDNSLVRRYVLRRNGKETELDSRDVVHFRYTSPGDPYYGRSPLEAALEAVKADEAVAVAQRRAFELGPMPGVILKSASPLTPEQQARLRADFESHFSGPDAAGRMIITDPDTEVVPFSAKPREMDFMDSARSTRDRILGCFGVPPAVLGLVEDFNRANAEAAHMLFARNTLYPKLKLIAARITQDVCSQFAPHGIKCNFASPVPADREADRKEMETAVRLGIVSTDEARADYFGKDPA
jgi:HK97 family phage portal protein